MCWYRSDSCKYFNAWVHIQRPISVNNDLLLEEGFVIVYICRLNDRPMNHEKIDKKQI